MKMIMIRDEAQYILDKLDICEKNDHLYYVHSKNIDKTVLALLEKDDIYVYKGNDYIYVCRNNNKEMAIEQMPLNPPA